MFMNDFTSAYLTSVKSYLKFLPLIIIPIAGIVFLVTAAPFYAVSSGIEEFEYRRKSKKRNLALFFGLSMATAISLLLIIILSFIAPAFFMRTEEYMVILGIYISFLIFSSMAAR